MPDWKTGLAYRWRKRGSAGFLLSWSRISIEYSPKIPAGDWRPDKADRAEHPPIHRRAHGQDVLLTGARGTGKSSLVKALLNKYSSKGLCLIEVDKQDLTDLPDIVDRIAEVPNKFILFRDDLCSMPTSLDTRP